jgi:SAM-dependent methyltransferase
MKPQSFFDDLYEKYPEGWGCSERRSQLFRYGLYLDMISRIQPPPRIVLDLGCGEGYLTSQLKERGECNVIGMDLSTVAIGRARQKYPGIDFYECSITGVRWDLLGPDRSPDLVVLGEVLYYLDEDERRACVAGIHEAIKDGAYVIVSVNIGREPYFTRGGLHDLFRAFRCIESRGIYLKSYHKHIETLLWNLRGQVKRGCAAERMLTTCLKFAPIAAINAFSKRVSESQESIHVALFRKGTS